MNAPIDLDANATTAPLLEVIETIARCLREVPGNPGSRHALGRKARQVLETSRETIAAILGAEPEEVHFTSGGTEANNLAISGLARGRNREVLLSPGEHPSTLEACRALSNRGWSLRMLPVDPHGFFTQAGWDAVQWADVGFATAILAHNETGVIQQTDPLAQRCHEHHIPLHLDGVQAVGKIDVNFHQLGATSLSCGAHKFHGPRGVGALLVRHGVKLSPLMFGGHQEQERRPGTEPVALIAGMARALELWHRDRAQRTAHLAMLRDRLQASLAAMCPPVIVHAADGGFAPKSSGVMLSPPQPNPLPRGGGEGTGHVLRLPNTLNIAFPGLDGEALLVALDLAGVCCSLGSTCASGSMEPAPMLLAMGVPADIAKASVRFSVSALNTAEEIDEAARRIATVVARLRGR